MGVVTVHNIWHTANGKVVLLDFADGECPKEDMILQSADNYQWKIIALGEAFWSSSALEVEAHKHLQPERWLYFCLVEELYTTELLDAGAVLTVVSGE